MILSPRVQTILTTFETNSQSVAELMKFDQIVLDFAITKLMTLQDRLSNVHQLNARFDVTDAVTILKNIRTNDSLGRHYAQMLNQCVVLLVSYFSAAAGDIFRTCITEAVRRGDRPRILREDIKIPLRDVRDIGQELQERAGELLAISKDISFQDMQSIGRAFREYLGYDRSQDSVVNDIIASQACRHVIVHSGAVVDRKMTNQLREAHPRSLKADVKEGDTIQFSEEEIRLTAQQMTGYLRELAVGVAPAEPA